MMGRLPRPVVENSIHPTVLAVGEIEAAIILLDSARNRLLADKVALPFLHVGVLAAMAAARAALEGVRMARDTNLAGYVARGKS